MEKSNFDGGLSENESSIDFGILNDFQQSLKCKYKDKLISSKKTSKDVLEYVKEKYDLIDVSANRYKLELEKSLAKKYLIASHHNDDNKLDKDSLEFKSFMVRNNEKSNELYFGGYINDEDVINLNTTYIYLVIEITTTYIYSNSVRLINDLQRFRGVSKYDIDNNTIELFNYLAALEDKKSIL